MDQTDNPAGRLLILLRELRTHAQGPSVRDAWRTVLKSKAADAFEVDMLAVSALLSDLVNDIEGLRGRTDVERYHKRIPRWAKLVTLPRVGGDQAFTADNVATDDELDMLADLSDLLSHRLSEGSLDPTLLEELLAQVTDLRDQVTTADDLDADLRVFLLQHLEALDRALRQVRIRGAQGLDDVLGRAIVDLARKPEQAERLRGHRLGAAFQKIIDLVLKVRQVAVAAVEIQNAVGQLTLPPGSGS